MIRVYVAGAMQAKPDEHRVLGFLRNLGKGIRATVEVLLEGYAVFCPFVDFHYWMFLWPDEEITEDMIKAQSMAWLEVCDAVIVVPDSDHSKGTQAEIKKAQALNIPVFYRIEDLNEWRDFYERSR